MKLQIGASSLTSEINENDPRWLAVVNRDCHADGQFYLAVKTTGIYCRPSCSARIPKPTNALFFQQREQAEAAGFRACKRCKPDQLLMLQESTKTQAIYPSNKRILEESRCLLGKKHPRHKDGKNQQRIDFAVESCSLGTVSVAITSQGICDIALADGVDALVRDLHSRFSHVELILGDGDHAQMIQEVIEFIEKPSITFKLPLDIRGTVFQQRVWRTLMNIPPGQTVTYTEIAQRIAAPKAIRAVANACATNTLAVVIPCHRVIRTDGGLSGYRWGIARKAELLRRESEA